MPSLQNVEKFKRVLRSLGQEPQILAERGEEFPDVRPPVGITQDDLSDLLEFSDVSESAEPEISGTVSDLFAPEDESGEFETEPGRLADESAFPDEAASADEPADDTGLDDSTDDFSIPEGLLGPDSDDAPFDEAPSAEELFSSDFSSSFGEDVTGDLFGDASHQAGGALSGTPSAGTARPEAGVSESPADDEFDISIPDEFQELLSDDGPFQDSETEPTGEPQFTDDAGDEAAFEVDEAGLGSDEFSFPDNDDADWSAPESPAAEGVSADEPAESDELEDEPDVDDFSIDEFNLGDLGEEFGLTDGPAATDQLGLDERLNPAQSPDALYQAELPVDDSGEFELTLTEEDFRRLRQTLSQLPRNLRIEIEELIGESKAGGDRLRELIRMLVDREPPQIIAKYTGELVGRKIPIPAGYEKKSFLELEREQSTFAYRFRQNILPLLRLLAVGAAAVALLTFLGYRFVYRPIYAEILYGRGYAQLEADRFGPAEDLFDRAVEQNPVRRWFYRYAEGFAAKRQFFAAEETYDKLLARFPFDRSGTLSYAALETGTLANYEKAERLLRTLLDRDMYDYEALLASGDNFLVWSDEDGSKFEEARRAYATLIQKYGDRDELLFRMLRYFVRTDTMDEVLKLKGYFLSARKVEIDPEAYAELGGYLVTKGMFEDVEDILLRAEKLDPRLPEIHYHLARFFREMKDYSEESKALSNARVMFESLGGLSRRRLGMLIDTHTRTGEALYRGGSYLDAEQSYRKAIALYEDALARRLLTPTPSYGRMYAGLGDLFYYVSGELENAEILYEKAREHGYATPELAYRIGYIDYSVGRFEDALLELHAAGDGYFDNRNLMFATANALFRRQDYFAAQAYYDQLLYSLERERDRIPAVRLEEDPKHRALIVFIMKVYNNLGVTLQRLAERTGDVGKASQALVFLTRSSEYYDKLSRNPETLERSATRNLAYLNTRAIIYPGAGYEAQIYTEIPRDHADPEF